MYPVIHLFGFQVYSFGIIITVCFFLFFWMLNRLGPRLGYTIDLYINNIFWFFISIFLFSRIFYIIAHWNDLKYIENFTEFFIMTDYNFNMIGGLIGFFVVFLILLKLKDENIGKYLFGFMLSFLFILPLAFFGALLGGQVFGTPDTNLGIEITYTHDLTPVSYKTPIFPLPIVYSIVFLLTFSGFYIANMYSRHKTLLGYLSLMVFCLIIFTLDFFSGKQDIFLNKIGINLSQISVLIILGFCIHKLYQIYKGKIIA